MTAYETTELPEHIRALLVPEIYEHPVRDIRLIQTHLSYVVLAGNFAYKLRKPLDLGFVDFTSLESRKRDCAEEIRLNSRTCSSLYLGVLSLSREGSRYRLGGPGQVIDYAVQMRRLSPELILSNQLEAHVVDFAAIGRLVTKLVRFHAGADGGRRVREIGGYATMVANWASNLTEIQRLVGETLPAAQFESIRRYADDFLHAERRLFERRENEGRIRDCHGDLRADAICADPGSPDGICIFDCLEFDERLRFSDTGLDICFLAMDIERRGFPEIASILLSLYTAAMGDKTLPLVSRLFRCYRAVVRGKVASILAGQSEVPAPERAAADTEARSHFELAASYARPDGGPLLVLVMGLTGTGKSVLAGALAHEIGAGILSTDVVRKEMAGALPTRHRPAPVGTQLYSPAATTQTYSELLRQAGVFLEEGRAVICDGTYLTRELRTPVLDLARRRAAPFVVVECSAPESLVRERQERRVSEPWTASDSTWDVYLSQRDLYEPPLEVSEPALLRIDTSESLPIQMTRVLGRLGDV